jgi:Tfp pilus assembly protein PilX
MNNKHQKGSTLILVMIMLAIMITTSIHFFTQSTDSTKVSGAARDSTQSLLLTESAMELLRGQFINQLDTNAVINNTDCDVAGTSLDKCEASALLQNIATPVNDLLPYMFYVSDTSAIDHSMPSLLQTIANGEGGFITTSLPLNSQKVSSAITELRINDMFNVEFKPMLYTVNNNGLLVQSLAANWDAEMAPQKAAAWIEVILNPDDTTAIDLYVQAISQVGNGRSFIQRYVGSYYSSDTLGGFISPLSESSEIARDPSAP